MTDEQKQKLKDYRREYVKNMTEEQKKVKRLSKRILCSKKVKQ